MGWSGPGASGVPCDHAAWCTCTGRKVQSRHPRLEEEVPSAVAVLSTGMTTAAPARFEGHPGGRLWLCGAGGRGACG